MNTDTKCAGDKQGFVLSVADSFLVWMDGVAGWIELFFATANTESQSESAEIGLTSQGALHAVLQFLPTFHIVSPSQIG